MEKVKEKAANPLAWVGVLIIVIVIAAFVLWFVERAVPIPTSRSDKEAQTLVQNLLGSVISCPEPPGNIDSVEVEKLIFADLDGDGNKELILCAWVIRDPFGHGLPEAEEPAP